MLTNFRFIPVELSVHPKRILKSGVEVVRLVVLAVGVKNDFHSFRSHFEFAAERLIDDVIETLLKEGSDLLTDSFESEDVLSDLVHGIADSLLI